MQLFVDRMMGLRLKSRLALAWMCLLVVLTTPFAYAADATLTAGELADLKGLAQGDAKAAAGIDAAIADGRHGELRQILKNAPFKGNNYGPAELRQFRNDARKFSQDAPARAAEARESIGKVNEAVHETGGGKYIDSHGGGKDGRAALMDKYGKIPTAEDAVRSEMGKGRPSVGQNGDQFWHGDKIEGRTQQLKNEVAALEKIRGSVPEAELAKVDAKLPGKIDEAIAAGKARIAAMEPVVADWKNRANNLPDVWNPDGTSKTAQPGDRPVPGTKPQAPGGPPAPPSTPEPAPRSLTDVQTRDWYHARLDEIDAKVAKMRADGTPLEQIAKEAHRLRNDAKMAARGLMADQEAAAKLPPPLSWEDAVKKYNGDYEKIIGKSQTSNKAVDAMIEAKRAAGEGAKPGAAEPTPAKGGGAPEPTPAKGTPVTEPAPAPCVKGGGAPPPPPSFAEKAGFVKPGGPTAGAQVKAQAGGVGLAILATAVGKEVEHRTGNPYAGAGAGLGVGLGGGAVMIKYGGGNVAKGLGGGLAAGAGGTIVREGVKWGGGTQTQGDVAGYATAGAIGAGFGGPIGAGGAVVAMAASDLVSAGMDYRYAKQAGEEIDKARRKVDVWRNFAAVQGRNLNTDPLLQPDRWEKMAATEDGIRQMRTLLADGAVDRINAIYQAQMGRPPTQAEVQDAKNHLIKGAWLSDVEKGVAFNKAAYGSVLGRDPDSGGLVTHNGVLGQNGGADNPQARAAVLRSLANSSEAGDRINDVYRRQLGRAPTADEMSAARATLARGDGLRALETKVGSFPNP